MHGPHPDWYPGALDCYGWTLEQRPPRVYVTRTAAVSFAGLIFGHTGDAKRRQLPCTAANIAAGQQLKSLAMRVRVYLYGTEGQRVTLAACPGAEGATQPMAAPNIQMCAADTGSGKNGEVAQNGSARGRSASTVTFRGPGWLPQGSSDDRNRPQASARDSSWLPDSCLSVLTRTAGDMNKPLGPGATVSG